MNAVSCESKEKMAVSSRAEPTLKAPTDALLRVTTSGICGSDLHMYDGRTPLKNGTVVGHEIMGVIEEVGDAVKSIKRDVSIDDVPEAYRKFDKRIEGYTKALIRMNESKISAASA
jgi:D-arabinose 1-dehydrogenase-like Zn-dependent alcohol dehydrogenase